MSLDLVRRVIGMGFDQSQGAIDFDPDDEHKGVRTYLEGRHPDGKIGPGSE